MDGLTDAYWITAATAIAGFFITCGLSWRNIKAGPGQGKDQKENAEKDEEGEISGAADENVEKKEAGEKKEVV